VPGRQLGVADFYFARDPRMLGERRRTSSGSGGSPLIRGINGIEIRSTGEALEIIARSTRQITVDLRRGGQTILLNYLIQ
jgi:hypothetical protein